MSVLIGRFLAVDLSKPQRQQTRPIPQERDAWVRIQGLLYSWLEAKQNHGKEAPTIRESDPHMVSARLQSSKQRTKPASTK